MGEGEGEREREREEGKGEREERERERERVREKEGEVNYYKVLYIQLCKCTQYLTCAIILQSKAILPLKPHHIKLCNETHANNFHN